MQAKLTPDDEAFYHDQLGRATPSHLALARKLQELAFPERAYPEGFQPAPLYLRLAFAIINAGLELRPR